MNELKTIGLFMFVKDKEGWVFTMWNVIATVFSLCCVVSVVWCFVDLMTEE